MGIGPDGIYCDTTGCGAFHGYGRKESVKEAGWMVVADNEGLHYYCPHCVQAWIRKPSGPEYYLLKQPCTEVRHVIEALNLGYNLGNVLKYVCRAGKKPGADYANDLRKAAQYIQFELERMERADLGAQGV